MNEILKCRKAQRWRGVIRAYSGGETCNSAWELYICGIFCHVSFCNMFSERLGGGSPV